MAKLDDEAAGPMILRHLIASLMIDILAALIAADLGVSGIGGLMAIGIVAANLCAFLSLAAFAPRRREPPL